jgi:hypothetical protein
VGRPLQIPGRASTFRQESTVKWTSLRCLNPDQFVIDQDGTVSGDLQERLVLVCLAVTHRSSSTTPPVVITLKQPGQTECGLPRHRRRIRRQQLLRRESLGEKPLLLGVSAQQGRYVGNQLKRNASIRQKCMIIEADDASWQFVGYAGRELREIGWCSLGIIPVRQVQTRLLLESKNLVKPLGMVSA